jgi:antitoxin (DNA-binding transcriptional repressor) of toxin-antitoxin stability system
MKALTKKEVKKNIFALLELVKNGEDILIQSDKDHENVAVIIPFRKYKKENRQLGILKGKASYKIKNDFKITDEELLTA